MRIAEWIALVYFAYLFVVALFKASWPTRVPALLQSAACGLAVVLLTQLPDAPPWSIVRSWAPGVYLLLGYWLSGLYFVSPMLHVEAWCLAFDRRVWERFNLASHIERAPRLTLELLELAYFLCFLLVPVGVGLVMIAQPALVDRAWSLVLIAEFGAFGMLPWIQTRPPRAVVPAHLPRPLIMRRPNSLVVEHASIGVNTLPSGHVAGSLASAIGVWMAVPEIGPFWLAIAVLITIGAVIGRYHYTIDAIGGALLAGAAWAIVTLIP